MEEQVLKVRNISKRYMLLSNQDNNDTFASVLKNSIKGAFSKRNQLSKGKEFWALQDINFTVNKGDRIGIIGHNGAGKSTLLKIFSRITIPTEGEIEVKGRIASLLEVGTGFHQELTGRENIYLNGSILGMSKEEIESKFNDIVQFSEIGDFLDTPVKKYSSGMYVKLAFAVAAHLNPDILIVDEVLAVGDMKFQEKCLGKMEDIAGGGRTVLYVSHNMRTVQQLCNRVIVLDHGKVIFDGNVDDGIKIYMDNVKEMSLYNDLSEAKRNDVNYGVHGQILSLKILDKKSCRFSNDENLKIMIKWRTVKKYNNVAFRVTILFGDKTPVGSMNTKSILNVDNEEIAYNVFETNISVLAPGKYIGKLVMYATNELGGFENIDVVEEAFAFEIIEEIEVGNNLEWLHRWWGHIRLQEMDYDA